MLRKLAASYILLAVSVNGAALPHKRETQVQARDLDLGDIVAGIASIAAEILPTDVIDGIESVIGGLVDATATDDSVGALATAAPGSDGSDITNTVTATDPFATPFAEDPFATPFASDSVDSSATDSVADSLATDSAADSSVTATATDPFATPFAEDPFATPFASDSVDSSATDSAADSFVTATDASGITQVSFATDASAASATLSSDAPFVTTIVDASGTETVTVPFTTTVVVGINTLTLTINSDDLTAAAADATPVAASGDDAGLAAPTPTPFVSDGDDSDSVDSSLATPSDDVTGFVTPTPVDPADPTGITLPGTPLLFSLPEGMPPPVGTPAPTGVTATTSKRRRNLKQREPDAAEVISAVMNILPSNIVQKAESVIGDILPGALPTAAPKAPVGGNNLAASASSSSASSSSSAAASPTKSHNAALGLQAGFTKFSLTATTVALASIAFGAFVAL